MPLFLGMILAHPDTLMKAREIVRNTKPALQDWKQTIQKKQEQRKSAEENIENGAAGNSDVLDMSSQLQTANGTQKQTDEVTAGNNSQPELPISTDGDKNTAIDTDIAGGSGDDASEFSRSEQKSNLNIQNDIEERR
ncbi:hypothetical protein RQN30_03640 [Arcanobacterium hippocoleae]